MKNIFFDEEIKENDLYFLCYMIERVARKLHQQNCYVVNHISREEWLRFTPTPRTTLRGVERMCKFSQSDTHFAAGDFKYGCRPLQFTRIEHKKLHKLACV